MLVIGNMNTTLGFFITMSPGNFPKGRLALPIKIKTNPKKIRTPPKNKNVLPMLLNITIPPFTRMGLFLQVQLFLFPSRYIGLYSQVPITFYGRLAPPWGFFN